MADLDDKELIQNSEDNALTNLAHRMTNPKLMALRAQNPFLSILPFPNEVIALAVPANTAVDIDLPDQTKMVRFVGNGEYYISRKGRAEIPNTASRATGDSLMNPEDCYWYVEEIRQLSVIAPQGVNLTVMCFVQG